MADDPLNTILKQLNSLRKTVNTVAADVSGLKQDMGEVKKTLKDHTKTLNNHTQTLNSHTQSLVTIEKTNGIYADMYKINDDNVRKIERRTRVVESNLNIEPPPENILMKVQ